MLLFKKRLSKSIIFYTFHKCASVLFTRHVLPKAKGLNHVDLDRMVNSGYDSKKIIFKNRGSIYGPLRIRPKASSYMLNQSKIINGLSSIFMIRDPRDMLISQYYSYGWTHPVNPQKELADPLLKQRYRIQSLTIDEYVIEEIEPMKAKFENMWSMYQDCRNPVLVKYEDMIDSWDMFKEKLSTKLKLDQSTWDLLYSESRPNEVIDSTAHKRSGKTGSYLYELAPETKEILNQALLSILERHDYKIK